jgi:hypothetical protein
VHGIDHGDDILDWGSRLHVVYAVEHESSSRREYFTPTQNLLPYFSRFSKGQNFLGVHAATPEDKSVSKVRL